MILSGGCGAAQPHHNHQKKECARDAVSRTPKLALALSKYVSKASWQCRLLLLKHLYILADKRDKRASCAVLGAMDRSIERDLSQVPQCVLIETLGLGGVANLPPDVSQSDHSQHEAAIQ